MLLRTDEASERETGRERERAGSLAEITANICEWITKMREAKVSQSEIRTSVNSSIIRLEYQTERPTRTTGALINGQKSHLSLFLEVFQEEETKKKEK